MALEVTGARYGIFRLVDKSGQNLVMRAIAGEHLGRPAVEALPINATSVMGWVAKTRQPLNIPDVRAAPWSRIYYPLDHALEMRSELAVPLIGAGGRLEGVLNLESPQLGAFTEARQPPAAGAGHPGRDRHPGGAPARRPAGDGRPPADPARASRCSDTWSSWPATCSTRAASAIWILDGDELTLQAASAGHVRGDQLPLHGSLTGQAILTRARVTSERCAHRPALRLA